MGIASLGGSGSRSTTGVDSHQRPRSYAQRFTDPLVDSIDTEQRVRCNAEDEGINLSHRHVGVLQCP